MAYTKWTFLSGIEKEHDVLFTSDIKIYFLGQIIGEKISKSLIFLVLSYLNYLISLVYYLNNQYFIYSSALGASLYAKIREYKWIYSIVID